MTSRRAPHCGFTLTEMLIVIGIIVLLLGILLPTLSAVRRSAERNAARMDLQTISVALDAYKADFGDYPRPPEGQRKYRVLCWALLGPYDAAQSGLVDPLSTASPKKQLADGADGPGFRTSWDPGPSPPTTGKGSKVWGPYLPPDKFRWINPTLDKAPPGYVDLRWDIADRYGNPIEYFPRWRTGPKLHLFGKTAAQADTSMYDHRQQLLADPASGTPNADYQGIKYLRRALGDIGGDDLINGSETLAETPPFLLLTPGLLRQYSDDNTINTKFSKCEEITNLQH